MFYCSFKTWKVKQKCPFWSHLQEPDWLSWFSIQGRTQARLLLRTTHHALKVDFQTFFFFAPPPLCRTKRAWSRRTWFLTRWTWLWTRRRPPWWPKSWSSCCWTPSLWAVTFPEPRCPTTTTSQETWCCPRWDWSWETACCWTTWRSEDPLQQTRDRK